MIVHPDLYKAMSFQNLLVSCHFIHLQILYSKCFLLPHAGFYLYSVQSVLITTNVVSSNSVHGEMYSIQHYVIKFVSDLRQVGQWFSLGIAVSSTNKTDCHDITEILLKVALNTINPTFSIHLYNYDNPNQLTSQDIVLLCEYE